MDGIAVLIFVRTSGVSTTIRTPDVIKPTPELLLDRYNKWGNDGTLLEIIAWSRDWSVWPGPQHPSGQQNILSAFGYPPELKIDYGERDS